MVYLYVYKLEEKEKHRSQRFLEDSCRRYFCEQIYEERLSAGVIKEQLSVDLKRRSLSRNLTGEELSYSSNVGHSFDCLAARQCCEGLNFAKQGGHRMTGEAVRRISKLEPPDEDSDGKTDEDEVLRIFKDERGKPYINREGFFISATHSGNLVICGISTAPLGIDIQIYQDNIKYRAIAKRFFSQQESELINSTGAEAFFKIWSIKEAFAKYDGRGLAYGLKNIQTVRERELDGRAENDLLDSINGVRIITQQYNDMFFACAGGEGDLKWIEVRR